MHGVSQGQKRMDRVDNGEQDSAEQKGNDKKAAQRRNGTHPLFEEPAPGGAHACPGGSAKECQFTRRLEAGLLETVVIDPACKQSGIPLSLVNPGGQYLVDDRGYLPAQKIIDGKRDQCGLWNG